MKNSQLGCSKLSLNSYCLYTWVSILYSQACTCAYKYIQLLIAGQQNSKSVTCFQIECIANQLLAIYVAKCPLAK